MASGETPLNLQSFETKGVTVGRDQLLTSAVVSNEGNGADFTSSGVF